MMPKNIYLLLMLRLDLAFVVDLDFFLTKDEHKD